MAFKTQAEIWEHLLKNGKLKLSSFDWHFYLKDGMFTNSKGYRELATFDAPEQWSIYEEPKPKKKVTLYRYTLQHKDGAITQSIWRNIPVMGAPHFKIIHTESKEIEVDDV